MNLPPRIAVLASFVYMTLAMSMPIASIHYARFNPTICPGTTRRKFPTPVVPKGQNARTNRRPRFSRHAQTTIVDTRHRPALEG